MFAFEHTGLYSYPMSVYFSEKKYSYIVIPGLELKRSMGITRGKDDKIDAKRIASYTYEKRRKLKPYELPQENIIQIKRLLSLREKLVKQRAGYKGTLGEFKTFLKRKDNKMLFDIHEKMIKELSKQIEKLEKKLDDIVQNDQQIKQMYKLIISIKGVGPQTALFLIVYTDKFTRFDKSILAKISMLILEEVDSISLSELIKMRLDKFEDINNINFRLELNGKLVQKANTGEMIFKVDELIEHVTKYMTIKIGDLL